MATIGAAPARALRLTPPFPGWRRASHLMERNIVQYKTNWLIVVAGFAEPLFYLLSIGVGIGKLIGHGVSVDGRAVPYEAFVAPGMLAASAMNGAVYDATFNVFFKLRYLKLYDAVLATPLGIGDVVAGEVAWALVRGTLYAVAFLTVMAGLGLPASWWTLADLPAAMLIGFAFAAVGVATVTFMREWQDFEFVQLVLLPMFLFSATFYPLGIYPSALRLVVRLTPLYQGVAVLRDLTFGGPQWVLLGHLGYLVVLGGLGLLVARRQLSRQLLR
jgi:lipooligosaccharide transport system permease protein